MSTWTHVSPRLVAPIVNVEIPMDKPFARVCLSIVAHHPIVDQNVLSAQNVLMTRHVWTKNVLIHAYKRVVPTPFVYLKTIARYALVKTDLREIHLPDAIRLKVRNFVSSLYSIHRLCLELLKFNFQKNCSTTNHSPAKWLSWPMQSLCLWTLFRM